MRKPINNIKNLCEPEPTKKLRDRSRRFDGKGACLYDGRFPAFGALCPSQLRQGVIGHTLLYYFLDKNMYQRAKAVYRLFFRFAGCGNIKQMRIGDIERSLFDNLYPKIGECGGHMCTIPHSAPFASRARGLARARFLEIIRFHETFQTHILKRARFDIPLLAWTAYEDDAFRHSRRIGRFSRNNA